MFVYIDIYIYINIYKYIYKYIYINIYIYIHIYIYIYILYIYTTATKGVRYQKYAMVKLYYTAKSYIVLIAT